MTFTAALTKKPCASRLCAFVVAVCLTGLLATTGCTTRPPANPSFSLSYQQAENALQQMASDPKPLRRPLVILNGWFDPGITASELYQQFQRVLDDDRILVVSFFWADTYEECRQRVLQAVEEAFPNPDPRQTVPVDVVAFSMGGIVARFAADPSFIEKGTMTLPRLRIVRLFTISSPHRGAKMADWPSWSELVHGMRAGSDLLTALNGRVDQIDYSIYPYVRLEDEMVGPANAAPPGQTPWWVPNPRFSRAHDGAATDPRILADIARRLRDEPPYSTKPAAPFAKKPM